MNTQRKRLTHRRGLRITLIPLLAATSLVACGDKNGPSLSQSTSASGTSATTAPPASNATPGTTAASAATPATANTTTTTDPCFPIGTLTTFDLNDRCAGTAGEDFGDDFASVLKTLRYWVDGSCPNGALVVAQPDQVLVTVTDPSQLDDSVKQVITNLPNGGTTDGAAKTNLAQVINVPQGTDVDEILGRLPDLQGVGYSTDLNYLEPVQPNYGFRPYDNPHFAAGAQVPDTPGPEGAPSILVLDSTDNTKLYDVDGNGLVDEDNGHGVFVRSIIQGAAPGAAVTLQSVTSTANKLQSGRWVPMMFSDSDLLAAMEPHFGSGTGAAFKIDNSIAVVNLSLGGAGCTTTDRFGHGVGERVSLAREMAAFAAVNSSMRFVAAAGNDHGLADHLNFKHFPAAWRDETATSELATRVGGRDPAAAQQIQDIHGVLKNAMFAVGAGDGDEYTNCGLWINAVADGTATGNYQAGLATWRGTSFATANVSAQLANGQSPSGTLPCPQGSV